MIPKYKRDTEPPSVPTLPVGGAPPSYEPPAVPQPTGAGWQVFVVVLQYSWYRQPFGVHVRPAGHWQLAGWLGGARFAQAAASVMPPASLVVEEPASPHVPPRGTQPPVCPPVGLSTGAHVSSLVHWLLVSLCFTQ
jgi:hypothetical protein